MPPNLLSFFRPPASLPISSTKTKILLALAPVALSTAYIVYLRRRFSSRTTALATISPPDTLPAEYLAPTSDKSDGSTGPVVNPLPGEVQANPREYVVARERIVSLPISISALKAEFATHVAGCEKNRGGNREGSEALLNAYLQTTMRCFAWTPQALLMRRILKDAEAKRTFDAGYLQNCQFQEGDRVCGVYVVTSRRRAESDQSRKGEMVVLSLAPPAGWTGPVVKGCIIAGYESVGSDRLIFVNETMLWRRKGEKALFLEGAVGRWLHTFIVGWFVCEGVKTITDVSDKRKRL